MDLSSNLVAIAGAIALVVLLKLWKRAKHIKNKSKGKLVPEAPGGLPIIGHFHRLREKKNLALILSEMADKYGSMFSLRLGAHRAVIISNPKAIEECFTVNDRIIAYRPPSTQAKTIGYSSSSIGFAPYGPYWRNMRKLAAIELLSSQRTKMLNYVQKSEVDYLVKHLYKNCGLSNDKAVDFGELIQNCVFNMITRMVAGKRFDEGDKGVEDFNGRAMSEVIKDFMHIAGELVPGDFIPFIGWLDINGVAKNMKRVSDEVGFIIDKWIEEHKSKKTENEDKDFIDVMLSVVEDDPSMGLDQATIIKGTSTAMILAGSDTSSITATWLISNIIDNRRVLECCQKELDLKVGRDRCVEFDDLSKLDYLNAVIKETLRLYPPGPLGVPREVSEDCYILGHYIPKGTRLFINYYKLHRDPQVWDNPEEFIPERFLTDKSNFDVTGKNFEYLPFSGGRRSCPGTNLAMQVLNLSLARVIQAFDFSTPGNKPVDMTIAQAIVLPKKHPLEVVLSPRLDSHLYDQDCN